MNGTGDLDGFLAEPSVLPALRSAAQAAALWKGCLHTPAGLWASETCVTNTQF